MPNFTMIEKESHELFRELDKGLSDSISPQFFMEPKSFRSIVEILNVIDAKASLSGGSSNRTVLGSLKEDNPAYNALLEQRRIANDVIEMVVKFEHGGLNYTMETMTEVVKEYNRGREDVRSLRKSLSETTGVLTAKKNGQISMRDLWLKKVEAEESLRIMRDLEFLKETPLRLQRLMQQRRYLSAVLNLNKATFIMFGEDLVAVPGLMLVREQLMETKGSILESVVTELQATVMGLNEDDEEEGGGDGDDDEEEEDELHREMGRRRALQSQYGGTMGPIDLKELNETVEASLGNPSSKANSTLFIRLLVRAVGALACEEDVERMLLENTSNQFSAVLRRVRETALRRKLRKIKQGVDEKEGNTAMFSHYLGSLLNASVVVLQRLLYVLRLLHSMRRLRTGEHSGAYQMKDFNRRAVLELFDDIEISINKELKAHFVEKELVSVTDRAAAAPLTGAIGSAGALGDEAEDADYRPDEPTAIFLTSASLAAPVYKQILAFADHVNDILVAEAVHDPRGGQTEGLDAKVKPQSKPTGVVGAGVSLLDALQRKSSTAGQISIMDALAATGRTDVKFNSRVLEAVQIFLEEELMPMVQLSVNNDLREIQLNTAHLSLPITSGQGASTEAASRALGETVPLSYATLSCASTALPLYNYWLQLPQHNDMVLTILERLVRGFMQAAREELEAKSWRLLSFDEKYKSKVTAGMRRDPVYAAYKASVYDGASSVDELLLGMGVAGGSGGGGGGDVDWASSSSFSDSPSGGKGGANPELDGWGALWELSLVQYPTLGDKNSQHEDRIIKDFHVVATVSSVVHGCDWLVRQLQKACVATCKQHAIEAAARDSSAAVAPPPVSSPFQSKGHIVKKATDVLSKYGIQETAKKTIKQSVLDEQEPLKLAVASFCRDLSRLADDGLALLRGEWQVTCFHFLHKLCQVKFGGARAKEESSHEAEAIIAGLNQHLLAFQEAALNCVPSPAVSVLLSPLAQLLPRVLMRTIQVLCGNGNLGADSDRSKPLRLIVNCQQCLAMLLESTKPEPATQQRILNAMNDEFEKVRRYVTLLDMPPKELQGWIKSNSSEYQDYEFQTLWRVSVSRAHQDAASYGAKFVSFDELWREVQTKARAAERKAR